jgi:predicted esterase
VNNRRWPLLFVFDPGARAARATEQFQAAAERFGWVIAASEDSRNGPWSANERAITAMWPALMNGYAIDPARVYTAGHSGGASMAWVVAKETGQVAGVIGSGQPMPGQESDRPITFAWFGTAGYDDFNFLEVKGIDRRMERLGRPHRMELFQGGHQWPPVELADAALGWLELVAMKDGRRPRDASLASSVLSSDMKRARTVEERGVVTDARRSYAAIVETYATLADVSEARTQLAAIDADGRLKGQRRTEDRSDDRERERAAGIEQMLVRLAGEEPTSADRLRSMVGFDSMLKASRGDSYEAGSARRSMELLFMQASSLRRELEGKRDYGRAATALDLATGVHPERAALWIELAADRALSGQKGPAIAALQQAIEKGYSDGPALRSDERFERLRGTPAFDNLVK